MSDPVCLLELFGPQARAPGNGADNSLLGSWLALVSRPRPAKYAVLDDAGIPIPVAP